MRPDIILIHEFVDVIPKDLSEGMLYVCIPFATVVHRCCCGCGYEVVTPLSPTDWKLIFDGVSVSLHPSIGNWSFPCKSHYWIQHNRVHWAPRWSQSEIDAGRAADALAKTSYYGAHRPKAESAAISTAPAKSEPAGNLKTPVTPPKQRWFREFFRWLFGSS